MSIAVAAFITNWYCAVTPVVFHEVVKISSPALETVNSVPHITGTFSSENVLSDVNCLDNSVLCFQEEHIVNIRPLHDRVVVKRLESEETSAGGIVLPGSAQEKPMMGEVVAVGTGRVLENGDKRALDVKVGDKVLFGKYSGTEIKLEGQELMVMREDDLLAVLG